MFQLGKKRCCVMSLLCGIVLAATCAAAPVGSAAIAAFPFNNSSPQPDLDAVADGMPDLFIACAQKVPGVTFVERSALDKILAEQKITLAGLADRTTQARVGKLLGARYIVTGSMTVLNGKLKLNAHLLDVETTRVVKSAEASGSLDALLETVQPLAADVMKGIGIELPPLDPSRIDKSPEANLHFMRGLGCYHANMKDNAIGEFMKTMALEPAHARARWWNAACYFDQKEWDHAAVEYRRFLADFPKDPLSAEARKKLAQCEEEAAKKQGAPAP